MKRIFISAPILLIVLGVLLAPGAATAAEDGLGLEVYAGWMEPGPDLVGSNETFGVRYSNMFGRRVGLQVSLGYFSGELEGPEISDPVFTYNFDSETVLLDVGALIDLAPDASVSPMFVGGLGWAWVSTDRYATTAIPADELAAIDGDSLTLHLGFALEIDLCETMYVAPGVRGRWFENRDTGDLDLEGSVALGWRF